MVLKHTPKVVHDRKLLPAIFTIKLLQGGSYDNIYALNTVTICNNGIDNRALYNDKTDVLSSDK